MKRFYSNMLTVLCMSGLALTASAGESGSLDLSREFSHKKTNPQANLNVKSQPSFDHIISAYKVPGTKADPESIEGEWIFTIGDNYLGENSQGSIQVEVYATLIDGVVTFDMLENVETPLKAAFDEETGILTFKEEWVSTSTYMLYPMYIYQQPFIYDWNIDGTVYQDIKATFNNGFIIFPQDAGVEWSAYGEHNDKSSYVATVFICDLEGAVKLDHTPVDDNKYWTDEGNALLMDGWLLPGLGIDQTLPENQYSVPLQRNKEDRSVYRLVNPYKVGPAAQFNESTRNGYIYFQTGIKDAENHTLVAFNTYGAEAGFANSSMGITRFFCFNQVMYYYLRYQVPPEYLSMVFPNLPLTTLQNGVIKLTSGYDAAEQLVYDANFGTQMNWFGGMSWLTDDGQPINMDATIYLPTAAGIEEIGSLDNSEVTPEYYNLQGIRVENPQPGQLVIKKEGNKTTKFIVR